MGLRKVAGGGEDQPDRQKIGIVDPGQRIGSVAARTKSAGIGQGWRHMTMLAEP